MTNFVSEQEFWNSIYQNKNTGWDLKSPTPVFQRILKEMKIIHSCKLLILGSDYGYYPVEEAKDRIEVTAVDFSASAVSFAKKFTKKEKVNVDFIQHEFLKFEADSSSGFDAVYDYVTYSAINPA